MSSEAYKAGLALNAGQKSSTTIGGTVFDISKDAKGNVSVTPHWTTAPVAMTPAQQQAAADAKARADRTAALYKNAAIGARKSDEGQKSANDLLIPVLATIQSFSTNPTNIARYITDLSGTGEVSLVSQQASKALDLYKFSYFDFVNTVKGINVDTLTGVYEKYLAFFKDSTKTITIDVMKHKNSVPYEALLPDNLLDTIEHEFGHGIGVASGKALPAGSEADEMMADITAKKSNPAYTSNYFSEEQINQAIENDYFQGYRPSLHTYDATKVPFYKTVLTKVVNFIGKMAYPIAVSLPIVEDVLAWLNGNKSGTDAAVDAGKGAVSNAGGLVLGTEVAGACLTGGGAAAGPVGWIGCSAAGVTSAVLGTDIIKAGLDYYSSQLPIAYDKMAVGSVRYEAEIRPGQMLPDFEMPYGGVPYEVTAVPKENSNFGNVGNGFKNNNL
jgi:hypothetical protein